jgi:hypothetical protein
MERRIESDCPGGQSSDRAVAPRGRKEGRKEERKEGRKGGRNIKQDWKEIFEILYI